MVCAKHKACLLWPSQARRGAEPAAEDLPCGRLGEEPTKNLARGALSVDALFEWP